MGVRSGTVFFLVILAFSKLSFAEPEPIPPPPPKTDFDKAVESLFNRAKALSKESRKHRQEYEEMQAARKIEVEKEAKSMKDASEAAAFRAALAPHLYTGDPQANALAKVVGSFIGRTDVSADRKLRVYRAIATLQSDGQPLVPMAEAVGKEVARLKAKDSLTSDEKRLLSALREFDPIYQKNLSTRHTVGTHK